MTNPFSSSLGKSLRRAGVLSVLLLATRAYAQDGTALTGTVYDPSHAVVAGADVALSGATAKHVLTNASGQYTFVAIPAGSYRVTVKTAGFAPATVAATAVAGQSTVADVTLSVASASNSVVVKAGTSGAATDAYAVSNIAPGVMGQEPVVNEPYTVTTISADMIQNTQVKSFKDTMKFLPLVSYTEQQGPEILRPATRGFQGSIAQNTRMDGMAIAITGANPMEEFQELQVENGLGAAMYGPANPSGMFNFVLKRPTEERVNNIYLEQDSSTVGTIYGDFSGRVGKRKLFGYRSNLLYGDGSQWVDGSSLRRRLGEFAFDVRPGQHTTLDAHYSFYDIVQRGYPGWFSYGANKSLTGTAQDPAADYILPNAPDPTRRGYGQSYAGVNLTTQTVSGRLLHDFNSNWHAMAGGLGQRLDRFMDTPVNTITSNDGDYSSSLASGFAPRFGVKSDLGYITGVIRRWGIQQDVVIASEGYSFNQYGYVAPAAKNLLLGTANINAPVVFAPPVVGLPTNQHIYKSAIVNQQGITLGDFVQFAKRFAVRLAASQDWIGVDNNSINSTTFVVTRASGSNKNGVSPSVSAMYKPTDWSTFYGTWASSLQQGDIAPGGTENAGQALAPYRSKEWELGFKTDNHPVTLTTALFRLERPFANTVADTATGKTVFKIVGQQVNFGAEASASTTIKHRLLLNGGFTALNARLNDTQVAATNGKRFVGIPAYHSNLYAEYRVPGIQNLTFTGDWQFTGRRVQDDENLHYTNGFNTGDLGLRYAHSIWGGKLATFRINSQNITNTRYYSTISAGDITGTNASANTAHVGAPRTLSTTLQFTF